MYKCVLNVVPGEPLDGTGRVCIHLFVRDDRGVIVEPHVLHPAVEDGKVVKQKYVAKPTRGRLACDLNRKVAPVVKNGKTVITPRSDDPRAVTCPKCIESAEYADMMGVLDKE